MAEKRFFTDILLGADNLMIAHGTGTPEGSQTADVASFYIRSDATDGGDALYVKNSGTGNTGWLPVATIPDGASAGDVAFIGSDGNLGVDTTSSFTWDATNNRLGVNKASPDVALHVFDGGGFTSRMIFETNSTANFPGIQLQWDASANRRVLMRGGAVSSLNTDGGTDATEFQFYTRDSGGTLNQIIIFDQDGHININSGNELRLWNSSGWTGGNYIGISATGATGTQTYLLPTSVGTDGQYLELDNAGTGQLVWSTPSGGGTVDGSGDTDRIAFWQDTDTLTSAAGFTYDGTNLLIPDGVEIGIGETSPDSVIHAKHAWLANEGFITLENTSTTNLGIEFTWDGSSFKRILLEAVQTGVNGAEFRIYGKPDAAQVARVFFRIDDAADVTVEEGDLIVPAMTSATQSDVVYYNSATGRLSYGAAPSGGAETLDQLLDVEVSSVNDGDLLVYDAGSLDSWRAASSVPFEQIVSDEVATANNWFLTAVNPATKQLVDIRSLTNSNQEGMFTNSTGASLTINRTGDAGIILATGTNLQGNSFFQEIAGGAFIWQSYGLGGTVDSPISCLQSPGAVQIYQDSDGTGQGQSIGYFQASAHDGTSYRNCAVFGAFVDKDGPPIGSSTVVAGKWMFCVSDGVTPGFPQPALSIFHNHTVEVVRGDFRVRLGNQIQLYNGDNDSYVALQAPDIISAGSDNVLVLELPGDPGDNGQVLTTDGTGVLSWTTASGGSGASVQFDLNQSSPVLSVLDAVYHDGSDWQLAQSNSADTLGTHIVITKNGNDYELCQAGRVTVTSHGLTIGEYYFVSASVAGGLTSTEPAQYSNPLVYVEDANTIHVLPFRPSSVNSFSSFSDWVPIWAEESGNLNTATNSGFQFSFGNGDVADGNGLVVPYDYEIVAVTLSCQSAASATVEVYVGADGDTTSSATGATVALVSERHNSNILVSPVSGDAGDWITFRTIAPTTTGGTGGRVAAWIRPR